MISVIESPLPFAILLFLKANLKNQVLARKLIIIDYTSFQNHPSIVQVLVILMLIQCLLNG